MAAPPPAPPPAPIATLTEPQPNAYNSSFSYAQAARQQGNDSLNLSAPIAPNVQTSSFVPKVNIEHLGEPGLHFTEEECLNLEAPLRWTLIGSFSRGRPRLEKLRKDFLTAGFNGHCNITLLNNKQVLLSFSNTDDYYRCWMHKSWNFGFYSIIITKWVHNFNPNADSPIVPIWISLYGLPQQFFDYNVLMSIGNLIGTPIKVDRASLNRTRHHVARVCIELDVSKPLIDRIWLSFRECGLWQYVEYEGVPPYCSNCFNLGHSDSVCMIQKNCFKVIPWKPQGNSFKEGNKSIHVDEQGRTKGNDNGISTTDAAPKVSSADIFKLANYANKVSQVNLVQKELQGSISSPGIRHLPNAASSKVLILAQGSQVTSTPFKNAGTDINSGNQKIFTDQEDIADLVLQNDGAVLNSGKHKILNGNEVDKVHCDDLQIGENAGFVCGKQKIIGEISQDDFDFQHLVNEKAGWGPENECEVFHSGEHKIANGNDDDGTHCEVLQIDDAELVINCGKQLGSIRPTLDPVTSNPPNITENLQTDPISPSADLIKENIHHRSPLVYALDDLHIRSEKHIQRYISQLRMRYEEEEDEEELIVNASEQSADHTLNSVSDLQVNDPAPGEGGLDMDEEEAVAPNIHCGQSVQLRIQS